MNNVIAIREFMPMQNRTDLKIINPQKKTVNIHLLAWIKKSYENYKKRQDELRQKKIDELKKAAYNFYLDWYLTYTKGTVDFHEAIYRSGIATCDFAESAAEEWLMRRVKEGRLEESYRALRKEKARKLREQKQQQKVSKTAR